MKKLLNNRATWLWLIWGVSLVATSGSLFVDEVLKLEPCELCWIQRIFMYPIVIIGIVGYFNRDWRWYKYALPLAVLGGLVALYQNMLNWGWISSVCPITGASCVQSNPWFGFVTIPLLSLLAFVAIIFGIWQIGRIEKRD